MFVMSTREKGTNNSFEQFIWQFLSLVTKIVTLCIVTICKLNLFFLLFKYTRKALSLQWRILIKMPNICNNLIHFPFSSRESQEYDSCYQLFDVLGLLTCYMYLLMDFPFNSRENKFWCYLDHCKKELRHHLTFTYENLTAKKLKYNDWKNTINRLVIFKRIAVQIIIFTQEKLKHFDFICVYIVHKLIIK